MKLKGILNSDIAKGLADLGHMDLIAVGDCGLPIENNKKNPSIRIPAFGVQFINLWSVESFFNL